MARDLQFFIDTEPGRETWPGGAFARLRLADSEGQFAHHGANWLAMAEKGVTLIRWGDVPYNNFELTETKTNSSTISGGAGGVVFQTKVGPTDGDNVEVVSKRTFVPVAGNPSPGQDIPQTSIAACRVQVSSAANMGLSFGFVSSGATGIVSTPPTDGVYFVKAKNSTALIAQTIQNGGAANVTPTLATLTDAADVVLTVKFYLGPTAAQCWGEWWVNGTKTPFTAAQTSDIFDMIAAAHAMSAQIGFAVNGTTQRSGTVAWLVAETDR